MAYERGFDVTPASLDAIENLELDDGQLQLPAAAAIAKAAAASSDDDVFPYITKEEKRRGSLPFSGASARHGTSSSGANGKGNKSKESATDFLRALAEEAQEPPLPWYATLTDSRKYMFVCVFVAALTLLAILRPQFILYKTADGRVRVSIVKLVVWSAVTAYIAFAIPYALPPVTAVPLASSSGGLVGDAAEK